MTSLFAPGTDRTMAEESLLLVTSTVVPTETPGANHERSTRELILANRKIDSLLKQIAKLQASNIAARA